MRQAMLTLTRAPVDVISWPDNSEKPTTVLILISNKAYVVAYMLFHDRHLICRVIS